MRILPFLAFLVVLFLFSCKSQQVVIQNYLQHVDTSQNALLNLAEPRIQKNDLLSIKVFSQSIDPRTDIPYNLPEQAAAVGGGSSATAGFLVDENGNIEYPRIGSLH